MNVWLGLGKEKSFFVLKRLIEGWQETWCHDAWETHKPGFKSCLFPFFLLAISSNNSKFIILIPTMSPSVIAGKNVFLNWDNVVNGLESAGPGFKP